MKLLRANFVIGLALFSALAWSQDSFDFQISSVAILQSKKVQKELGISESLRANMNKTADSFNAKTASLNAKAQKVKSQAEAEKLSKEMDSILDEFRTKILKMLSSAQLKRLREITMQQLGYSALGESAVAKKIGIRSEQLGRIRSTLDSAFKQADDLSRKEMEAATKDLRDKKPKTDAEKKKLAVEFEKRVSAVQKKIEPKLNSIRQQTEKKLLSLLSDSQQKAWSGLKGKPFTI